MPRLLQQPANYSEHVVAQLQPVGKPDVESFDRIAGLHDIGAAQNAAEPLTKVALPTLALHVFTLDNHFGTDLSVCTILNQSVASVSLVIAW